MISGVTKWSVTLAPNTWYNFAYDIDFSSNLVGLWASTGSSPLTQVVAPQAASTSSNSADFHIGVLRLPNGGTNAAPEDWFWSGIFVESAPITTSIAGPQPGNSSPGSTTVTPTSTPSSSTTKTTTTTAPVSTTTTASGPTQTQYGQCGGNGYT
jgi:hypothetical protein